MEKAGLKKYFQTMHKAMWNLIEKLPAAFAHIPLLTKDNLRNVLRRDSEYALSGVYSIGAKALLTLTLLSAGSKMSAQNYKAGDKVLLPDGTYATVTIPATQQTSTTRQQSNTSNQSAQQYSSPQNYSSRYAHTQSSLARAQNTIIQNGLVVDAQLTEGLSRDEFAYACFSETNRDIIQLVKRNGSVIPTTRSRCFSNQSGCCDEYCGESRHIGIAEAQQLAYAGIRVANHTNETRQAFNSAMVEGAIMDGAVPTPMEEARMYERAGFHYNRDLSKGINPESGVYRVLTRGRHDAVIIYRTPRINEQTGEVSCAEPTTQPYLNSQKAGNAYPYDAPTRDYYHSGWRYGGRY